jgi:hypothetical protein
MKSEEPITHSGTDYGYKLCKCCKCGGIEECTPWRDFYPTTNDPVSPLMCESCLWEFARERVNSNKSNENPHN